MNNKFIALAKISTEDEIMKSLGKCLNIYYKQMLKENKIELLFYMQMLSIKISTEGKSIEDTVREMGEIENAVKLQDIMKR